MHIEMSEMSLDTAPRNVLELQRLSADEKTHLYVLLKEAEVLPPSSELTSFEKLGEVEQAAILLQALLDYDCDKEPEFSVIAIELPVRADTKKLNQSRWRAFGAEIEGALNRLGDAGLALETAMKFEGHGIIIVGRKQREEAPREITFGMPIPLASFLPKGIQEALAERSAPNPHRDKMSEVAAAVTKVITSTSSAEDIRPAVSSVIKTVEDLKGFREYALNERDTHEQGCTTPGCPAHLMLNVVLEEIDRRIGSFC